MSSVFEERETAVRRDPQKNVIGGREHGGKRAPVLFVLPGDQENILRDRVRHREDRRRQALSRPVDEPETGSVAGILSVRVKSA